MNQEFSNTHQIGVVSSFHELVQTDFVGAMNALCWFRNLEGDFRELVSQLILKDNITEVLVEDLFKLNLSEGGNRAREIIKRDFQLLKEFGASPAINLIKCYQRDEELDFFATDVYSYHVDRSPIGTDTYLCTYFGVASDIIANDQADQKILIPEIRTQLQELHDGPDADFESFLEEYFFDLHYQPKPHAKPVNLGTGHLWRLAVDHPSQQVLPCIHRAPEDKDGEYRLLLIC